MSRARRWALLLVALIAEVLSWIPLAIGYVVGVMIEAVVRGYQLGRGRVEPQIVYVEVESDE
jgi:hypothetical protein